MLLREASWCPLHDSYQKLARLPSLDLVDRIAPHNRLALRLGDGNLGAMLTCIRALLERAEVEALRSLAEGGRFVDGRRSAGGGLRSVKHNLELDASDEEGRRIGAMVLGALSRNPQIRSVALPKRMTAPILSRYTEGMEYGPHTDAPMLGSEEPLRSDLSVTIFLSDPEGYDGGELVIQTPLGEEEVKLLAGDAVVYPTTMLHRVARVRRGRRLVAVAWIQSYVRDPARRQLLHELDTVARRLIAADPQAANARDLKRIHSNLTRMWVEA